MINAPKPVQRHRRTDPDIWMIGRVDQFAVLATHLAQNNRLARWDSFWRHDGQGVIRPPARKLDPVLSDIPGRHLIPDLLGTAARKLRLPAHNLYSDIPLSLMAASHLPNAGILHGQGNYSLPAMRRAQQNGMITIADVTGQLAPVRQNQLADEYNAHGRTYHEISRFLARRRVAEAHFADAVFAPSDAVIDGLLKCGISPDKIFHIPFMSPLCQTLVNQERPTRTDATVRLLYVGNISIAKGIAALLDAWRALHAEFRGRISLTLIGPVQPCAQALVKDLPHGCDWLGRLSSDEVAQHLLGADIFVFPSLSEGSSLATLEAMAAGCTIVTTFDAGSPVINQQSGLIVPPRDPGALITAVSALITTPAMRQNIAQAARSQIKNMLETGYGNRVEMAYDTLLTRHG